MVRRNVFRVAFGFRKQRNCASEPSASSDRERPAREAETERGREIDRERERLTQQHVSNLVKTVESNDSPFCNRACKQSIKVYITLKFFSD